MPTWPAPYDRPGADRNRLVTAYQGLHDAIHARSGQTTGLKLVYMRTDNEACLAWVRFLRTLACVLASAMLTMTDNQTVRAVRGGGPGDVQVGSGLCRKRGCAVGAVGGN